MTTVMQIVNFIRAEGLNHLQFQSFLLDIDQSLLIFLTIQKCAGSVEEKYSVGCLSSAKKFVKSWKAKEKTQQCYRTKNGNVS